MIGAKNFIGCLIHQWLQEWSNCKVLFWDSIKPQKETFQERIFKSAQRFLFWMILTLWPKSCPILNVASSPPPLVQWTPPWCMQSIIAVRHRVSLILQEACHQNKCAHNLSKKSARYKTFNRHCLNKSNVINDFLHNHYEKQMGAGFYILTFLGWAFILENSYETYPLGILLYLALNYKRKRYRKWIRHKY